MKKHWLLWNSRDWNTWSSENLHSGPCGPISLAIATRLEPNGVIEVCRRYGWRNGMTCRALEKAALALGYNLYRVNSKSNDNKVMGCPTGPYSYHRTGYVEDRMTVSQFAKEFPKGTFILNVTRHFIVVRDGKVIDPAYNNKGKRRRVRRAYRVSKNS